MAKPYSWKSYLKGPGPYVVGGIAGVGLLWWLLKPAEAAPAPLSPAMPPRPSMALPPGAVPVMPGMPPMPAEAAPWWDALYPGISQIQWPNGPGGPGGPGQMPPPGAQMPPATVPSGPRPLGNPLQLQPGGTYRARIELGPFEAIAATRERVAQTFADLGFRGVVAYLTANELDPSWPTEARLGATDRTRWVRGAWGGQPETLARPPNVAAAWEG